MDWTLLTVFRLPYSPCSRVAGCLACHLRAALNIVEWLIPAHLMDPPLHLQAGYVLLPAAGVLPYDGHRSHASNTRFQHMVHQGTLSCFHAKLYHRIQSA